MLEEEEWRAEEQGATHALAKSVARRGGAQEHRGGGRRLKFLSYRIDKKVTKIIVETAEIDN